MKLGIIGLGIVGSAIKHGFEKLGHQVKTHDIKDNTHLKDVLDTEIVYLCVPTPQREDGHCDIAILEDTFRRNLLNFHYSQDIYLKYVLFEPSHF